MTNGWDTARRQRQSSQIQRWRPWEKSTGPKTAEGKAIVARNGYKGGAAREKLRALGRALKCLKARSSGLVKRHVQL